MDDKQMYEIWKWYDSLPDNERMQLMNEFGNEGIPNRERKFFEFLKTKYVSDETKN